MAPQVMQLLQDPGFHLSLILISCLRLPESQGHSPTAVTGAFSFGSLRPCRIGSTVGSGNRRPGAGLAGAGVTTSGTAFFPAGSSLGLDGERLTPAIPPTVDEGQIRTRLSAVLPLLGVLIGRQ